MKALVGAFNQEKALVGAFSVIVKTGCGTDGALHITSSNPAPCPVSAQTDAMRAEEMSPEASAQQPQWSPVGSVWPAGVLVPSCDPLYSCCTVHCTTHYTHLILHYTRVNTTLGACLGDCHVYGGRCIERHQCMKS